MNENPTSLNPAKPLDEGLLIDWIDGCLSPEEQSRLAATSGRQGLPRRIAQMQANARVLRSLPLEKPSVHLKGRILAALERESLLAMEQSGRADTHAIPIAVADELAARTRGTRWVKFGPSLALAAGLVLLIGGALYWGTLLFEHAKPTPRRDTSPIEEVAQSPSKTQVVADGVAPRENAMRSDEELAESTSTVATAEAPTEAAPLDSSRAIALAAEGRVVIRVRAGSTRNLSQLESASPRPDRPWRLTRTLPPEVTVALASKGPAGPILASKREPAAAALIAPLLGPNAGLSLPSPDDPLRRVKGAYVLDVPADPPALDSFRDMLAQRLEGQVELEELPEPVALPPASPEHTLWWTQPPSEWTPRVKIPVIVEVGS
jgi:hypothetical protein